MNKFAIDPILELLADEVKKYAVPVVDLIAVQSNDPYRILVGALLSARTRDETTAKAAARLFKQAPTQDRLAEMPEEEIARLIYPVGFYKNKARFLAELPVVLRRDFNSQIPTEVDELVRLPGVGRKTANLVSAVAFGIPAICVDTHVHRIMNIWGYVRTDTPLATEMALRKKLPKPLWKKVNSILVAFGQAICKPVRPLCGSCVIAGDCPRGGTGKKVS